VNQQQAAVFLPLHPNPTCNAQSKQQHLALPYNRLAPRRPEANTLDASAMFDESPSLVSVCRREQAPGEQRHRRGFAVKLVPVLHRRSCGACTAPTHQRLATCDLRPRAVRRRRSCECCWLMAPAGARLSRDPN
jgi:hypothetical protein